MDVETLDMHIRVLGAISILGEMKSSGDIGYNLQIFALDTKIQDPSTKIQDPSNKCFGQNGECVI